MLEREDIVVAILSAAGGELVGRVRLQKTAYLLGKLGFSTELEFDYHHYGPYSRDLDNGVIDARAFGLLKEEFGHRQSDGAMYSRYVLTPTAEVKNKAFGKLSRKRTEELVGIFANTNVTVLELAATVLWLCEEEGSSDWQSEIARRKGRKVENGRLEKAVELLKTVGLAPPPPAPSVAVS